MFKICFWNSTTERRIVRIKFMFGLQFFHVRLLQLTGFFFASRFLNFFSLPLLLQFNERKNSCSSFVSCTVCFNEIIHIHAHSRKQNNNNNYNKLSLLTTVSLSWWCLCSVSCLLAIPWWSSFWYLFLVIVENNHSVWTFYDHFLQNLFIFLTWPINNWTFKSIQTYSQRTPSSICTIFHFVISEGKWSLFLFSLFFILQTRLYWTWDIHYWFGSISK